jgi:hypothetical protein
MLKKDAWRKNAKKENEAHKDCIIYCRPGLNMALEDCSGREKIVRQLTCFRRK